MSSWSETKLSLELNKLRDRWFPRILACVKEADSQYFVYEDGTWSGVDDLPETQSPFTQVTLLIPDSESFFNLRRFPVDSVTKQALREAVELDLARWSPWQEGVEFYYWPKRSGDFWQVAVWVWQSEYRATISQTLDVSPTHIMPERAWKIASHSLEGAGFIHVDSAGDGAWAYTEVSPDFITLRIAEVKDEAGAKRFKTAQVDKSMPVSVDPETDHSSLPWEESQKLSTASYSVPVSSALLSARLSGVRDWADPFVWARPVSALLALYALWLFGSGLVLLKHGEEVQEYSAQANSVSIEVLDARAEVDRINNLLESIDRERANQLALESVLASLSAALPQNAWLDHIEYRGDDGGWLEITGKSGQSTPLAAVLEQMPEVEQAMFLSDIRKDKNTGLEPFKIRLKLVGEL